MKYFRLIHYFILLFLLFTSLYAKTETSFVLYDFESHKILEQEIQNKQHIPGSVVKLLTGFYAIKKLGPTFKPTTSIYIDGEVKNGELNGDLILQGGGDPLLFAADLYNMVLQIKRQGITRITGKLYFDDSIFAKTLMINPKGENNSPDNSGVSGLNLEFNRYPVIHNPVDQALPPIVSDLELKSLFDLKKISSAPVFETSLWASKYFQYLLSLERIFPKEVSFKKTPQSAKLIYTHEGSELSEMVKLMMEYSNNVVADSLLMLACSTKDNLANCAEEMVAWYQTQLSKKIDHQLMLKNGSGMHYDSWIEPLLLTEILAYLWADQTLDPSYRSLLPIGGNSGWLLSRMKSKELFFKVHAKTGSIDFVSNIAGIVRTFKGRELVFVIMSMDSAKRSELTKIVNQSAGDILKSEAKSFAANHKKFEDQLILSWQIKY